jgi:hypothetical protein
VTVVDSCPVSAGPDLPMPVRDTSVTDSGESRCRVYFGDGAVCFGPGAAWRLAAVIEQAGNLRRDVKACERTTSSDSNSSEAVDGVEVEMIEDEEP